jgi:Putative transposase of IS4/5 family (DUF4096)
MSSTRKPYPSDVSDDEWASVAPYLTLLSEDVSQRKYDVREVFKGLRYLVKTGVHWRMLPHDLPPWPVVYQQMRRWLAAEWFEAPESSCGSGAMAISSSKQRTIVHSPLSNSLARVRFAAASPAWPARASPWEPLVLQPGIQEEGSSEQHRVPTPDEHKEEEVSHVRYGMRRRDPRQRRGGDL